MRKQIITTAAALAVAIPAGTAHAAPSVTRPPAAAVHVAKAGPAPVYTPFGKRSLRKCPTRYVCRHATTFVPGTAPFNFDLCASIPCGYLNKRGMDKLNYLQHPRKRPGTKVQGTFTAGDFWRWIGQGVAISIPTIIIVGKTWSTRYGV